MKTAKLIVIAVYLLCTIGLVNYTQSTGQLQLAAVCAILFIAPIWVLFDPRQTKRNIRKF